MTIDHAELMRELPIPFLVYEAQAPYRILDENAAHEDVAFTKREDIVGKPFLEAFPDTSEAFRKTGKSAPIESIKKIVRTKKPDSLGEFSWDVTDADGSTISKCWRSTQYPIFDETGKKVVAVYQLTEDISHEMETEQTLEQTQKKLMEVLATGQVGTWSLDLTNGIAKGGPNLSRMFGIDPELTAKGIPLSDFTSKIHEEDRARVGAEIDHAVKTNEPYESEYRIVKEDGGVRWVLARGQMKSEDLDGTNVFSGTLIDITERKENERILTESEARLRFLADSMPQLVWITQPDGFHEYYNQKWYEYTGTQPGSTDGEGWNGLFHPDDQARAWKLWRHSLRTGEPYEIQYRLYHAPSSQYRWVIGRALPLHGEDGKIIKWYGTCTDVDEQVHHSNQQTFLSKVSKELVSGLDMKKMLAKITKLSVPTISDWCSVDLYSDENGFEQVSVAHADPKKVDLALEYRRHNPLNVDDDTAIPRMLKTGKPEFYPVITDDMLRTYITEKDKLDFMLSLKLSSIMIVPLKDGKKTIGGISFVAADSGRRFSEEDFLMAQELGARISLSITNVRVYEELQRNLTHRRELEKQLRQEKAGLEARVKERTTQLQLTNQGLREEIERRQSVERELNAYGAELARSNQELEDFAYVASHDLQEPLRKIQAFGNLLLGEYGDTLGLEGADYLKRMHSAANRMSTLIEDLLTFSRVARTEPRRQSVDLAATLHDVVSDLETRITDTGAKVSIGKLPAVMADPTHMRQLFQNIIGNAIKFHRPGVGPEVSVRSKSKRGGFEISIADNGIGFDEKYLDRIFSVFQRLHERSDYEGTGIGLAVCRKIVERYGGTITAESTKGAGSKFIIWLPGKSK
jgi:PAS domain S-box-containing protein